MTQNHYYTRHWVLQRYAQGPLSDHIDSYAHFLKSLGYPYTTGQRYIREVGRLNRWLNCQGIRTENIGEHVIKRYLRIRMRGRKSRLQKGPYNRLLEYLRQADIIENVTDPEGSLDVYIYQYKNHLIQNKGLKKETIRRCLRVVSNFISNQFGQEQFKPSKLCPQKIDQYLLDRSGKCSHLTLNGEASALRSFFRFLQIHDEISPRLIDAVPSVPCWRQKNVPSFLTSNQTKALIEHSTGKTAKGLRDKAILLILIQLGIRAIEVCRLTLDDIEWQAGYINVQGKNTKSSRLPLLHDVGQAISAYLFYGRPECSTRYLFVRASAPFKAFASSSAVAGIVRRALIWADLNPPHKGSHLLRHSCATQMLQKGASLAEIGQILRHQKVDTTAIYAKIDLNRLRPIAGTWPKGGCYE
jgi:site-specific recombinase XerD